MDERDVVIQGMRKEQEKMKRKIDQLENELWRLREGLKKLLEKYGGGQKAEERKDGRA
jgi:hypothetical protein